MYRRCGKYYVDRTLRCNLPRGHSIPWHMTGDGAEWLDSSCAPDGWWKRFWRWMTE